MLKFEFHVFSYIIKYYSSFDYFQIFKNVKTILSSWAVQKQAAGQIWPTGHHSPILALCKHNLEERCYGNRRHYAEGWEEVGRSLLHLLHLFSLCTLD